MRMITKSPLWIGAIAVAAVALGGCYWPQSRPADYEFHGKVGWGCAVISTPVVAAVHVICLPLYVPCMVIAAATAENENEAFRLMLVPMFPGHAVEIGAYYIGAITAYPVYYYRVALPKRRRLSEMSDSERVDYLLSKWPYLSPSEYRQIVVGSGRHYAPPLYGYSRTFRFYDFSFTSS